MTFRTKQFIKKFNGSAVYHKPSKRLSPDDVSRICCGSKLAKNQTPEKLIHSARIHPSGT